jgi:serine/threonine protein kinase
VNPSCFIRTIRSRDDSAVAERLSRGESEGASLLDQGVQRYCMRWRCGNGEVECRVLTSPCPDPRAHAKERPMKATRSDGDAAMVASIDEDTARSQGRASNERVRHERSPKPEAIVRSLGQVEVGVLTECPTAAAPLSSSRSPREVPVSAVYPRADAEALALVGLKPGDVVGGVYRIERALGSGGMGLVALALDERLDRRVAIKLIRAELFGLADMRAYFDNEARAMARVSHPNVVQIYSFGEHGEFPYFVMEYVEGTTIEQWMRSRSRTGLPELDEVVRIIEQACLGVEAIHAASTVHRDVKPSNLLMEKSGRVRVVDLGVARILESAASSDVVVGSALYMAPEAVLGEKDGPELAHRRDIYALGCVTYELMTGHPPFMGPTDVSILSQHVLAPPKPPSVYRACISRALDSVVLKSLAKDPRQRFSSCASFRKALIAEHTGAIEPERILVVDDDAEWRAVLSEVLRARFPTAQVEQAADGVEALRAVECASYSVVLVDLKMPEVDGACLTRQLRKLEACESTPIVVLTAAGGPREWKRLSEMGADAFLVKPVNADDVELLIRRTLRSRRALSLPPGSSPSSSKLIGR